MVDEVNNEIKKPSLLLPNNKTPLEIALADLAPRLSLFALADSIKGYRTNISDNVAPFLAAEWNLGEFIDYFDGDAQELIKEGVEWLQKRGTAEAVKIALSWIGFDEDLIKVESQKGKIHIDIGTADNVVEQLEDIKFLIKESLPTNAELYRIYHNYDRRVLYNDIGSFNNELLSDDSGVWIDGVKISLQNEYKNIIDFDAELAISSVLSRIHNVYIQRKRGIYYDFCAWGDKIPLDGSFVVSISHLINANKGGVFTTEKNTAWNNLNDKTWNDINANWKDSYVIDNTEPNIFPSRFLAKSSLAGGYSVYGDLNCYWGGGIITKYFGKSVLDNFRWGEKTEYFEYNKIYEIKENKVQIQSDKDFDLIKEVKISQSLNNITSPIFQRDSNVKFSHNFYFDDPNNACLITNHFANYRNHYYYTNELYANYRSLKNHYSANFGNQIIANSFNHLNDFNDNYKFGLLNENKKQINRMTENNNNDGAFLLNKYHYFDIVNFNLTPEIYHSRDKQTWNEDNTAKWDKNSWRGMIVFNHQVL